jgi:hypothetical protein
MVGGATAALSRRLPFGLAWLPAILLTAHDALRLPDYVGREKLNAEFGRRARTMAQSLRDNGVRCVYVPYAFHALNFLLEEEFCFTDFQQERYRPYARTAELDPAPAVLNNYGGFKGFLAATDATFEAGGAPWLGLYMRARRNVAGRREIPPSDLRVIRVDGNLPLIVLGDADLGTAVQLESAPASVELRIALDAARRIAGVRVLCPPGAYPDTLTLQTRRSAPGVAARSDFFWSGARFYWGGRAYRHEQWFAPRATAEIKLVVGMTRPGAKAALAEVQVFEATDATPTPEEAALADLTAFLSARRATGAGAIYCDRWVANRLYAAPQGAFRTPREPGVFRDDAGSLPWTIPPGTTAAMLVRREDADLSLRALRSAGAGTVAQFIGPWTLLRAEVPATAQLVWAGVGCLRGTAPE